MHETKIENNKSEINNLTIVDYNMWSYRDFFLMFLQLELCEQSLLKFGNLAKIKALQGDLGQIRW